MSLEQCRLDLERQELKASLTHDFDQRVSEMHVQLLSNQHKFDEYRRTIEKELKQQLRAAQSHLVGQMVDQSGAMSIETKTSLLDTLHGQSALEQLQQENVSLKQTLLKLQTIYDMQQQTRDVATEKERLARETERLRAAHFAIENAQLQNQVRQLETEMTKVSQERAFYQLKFTELQKQNDATARRQREAKVRALSAHCRRRLDGLVEQDNAPTISHQPLDWESQEDAAEQRFQLAIRSPMRKCGTGNQENGVLSKDELILRRDRHLQNASRHYQSEIKRLQQQLAKEVKAKAQLIEQLAELRVLATDVKGGDDDSSNKPPPGCGIPAASPRIRAASASVCATRRAQGAMATPKRPCYSFSPRLYAAAGPIARTPRMIRVQELANDHEPQSVEPSPSHQPTSLPPRASSASSATHRKFEVLQRDPPVAKVGGVAGVQNPLFARETLPYR